MRGMVSAFLVGFLMTLVLDFFFFIALKVHYFDFYGIKEYFNVIFIDNQSALIFFTATIILGTLSAYSANIKFPALIYLFLIAVSLLFFIPTIGREAGSRLFYDSNATIEIGRHVVDVDILYRARLADYVLLHSNKKIIAIEREKHIETY